MTNNYIDLKDYRLFFVEKVGEFRKCQAAPLNDVDNKDKWKEVIVPISLISRYLKDYEMLQFENEHLTKIVNLIDEKRNAVKGLLACANGNEVLNYIKQNEGE